MNNKLVMQKISGVLLFISYFSSWAYDGGIFKTSANDLANLELWGGHTPFLMEFLILLPVFGIISFYLGWTKKYSYAYNLGLSVFVSLILIRTGILIKSSQHQVFEIGFYLAVLGVAASIYSIVIIKRELKGAENEELKMLLEKFKKLIDKLNKTNKN